MRKNRSEGRSDSAQATGKEGASPAGSSPWLSNVHEAATVIVLAGGRSTRMGADKSLLPFQGKPLIQHVCAQVRPHFDELLISSDNVRELALLDAPVISDEVSGQGPLRGIASALAVSRHDLNFVIACDIPWVNTTLLRDLLREAQGCDCVLPVTGDGHFEPLFAVYRKSVLPYIQNALEAGERRIVRALRDCRMKTVRIASPDGIDNINMPEDYRRILMDKK